MDYTQRVIIFILVWFFGFSAHRGYASDKESSSFEEYEQQAAMSRGEIDVLQKKSQRAKELQNEIKKEAEEYAERQFILSVMGSVSLETMLALKAIGLVDKVVYIGKLLQFKRDLKFLDPVFDSSQLKQATAQSLINTQTVYYTEKIVGSWLSDTLHGSGGGWLETLRFNRGGSYSVTTSSGGQYSGVYSVIPSSDMGIYSTPKTLSFDVSQSNNGGGTLNQDVGYGRGLTIQNNKMTLQADIQNEKAMVDGYTKQ